MNAPALYTISKTLDVETLNDIRYDGQHAEEVDAEVRGEGKRGVYENFRKSKLKLLPATNYPDICEQLINILGYHRPKLPIEKFHVNEFNYLSYSEGGHFTTHHDVIDDKYPRRYTTITLLNKSEDLEGGELIVWEGDPKHTEPSPIELEVDDTVIFDSKLWHQLTPIIRGTRECLVAWIYEK